MIWKPATIESLSLGLIEIEGPAHSFLKGVKDRLLSILLTMIHGDLYVRSPSAARWINQLRRQEQLICDNLDDFFKLLWDMTIALIERIPYTHEAQNTIITFVLELKKLAKDETQLSKVRSPIRSTGARAKAKGTGECAITVETTTGRADRTHTSMTTFKVSA